MDHSLTIADAANDAGAGAALALIQDPALDSLFLRPGRTGVASAWYGHVPFAHWLVAAARPHLLVELGTHNGVSYSAFCAAAAQAGSGTRCYAVDTWRGDEHAGQYGDEVLEDLRRFHDPLYGAFSTLMRCTFDQALPYFADGSVDLLHIDGLHTYEAVRADFLSWQPKLSPRAVVLFHDTNERRDDFGVWRLWAELRELHPGFEFLHSHGLGVLAPGPDAPPGVRALCGAGPEASALLRDRFSQLGERWMDHFEASQALAGQRAAEARNAGLTGELGAARLARQQAEAAGASLHASLHAALHAAAEATRRDIGALEADLAGRDARLAVLRGEHDALQQEHADTLDDLHRGWSYQRELSAKLDAGEAHAAHLKGLLAERAAEWERVHAILIGRDADAAGLRAALAEARAMQAAMHRSVSWRLTRPVRLLGCLPPLRRVRRFLGLVRRGGLGERRRLLAQRAAEAAALRATPLFHAAWYLQQHPGLAAAGHDPAAHFAWTGAASGAQPNPWFDTGWYLARNPAVAASGENPLLHWIREGAAAGLDPNPFLDVDWYAARHGLPADGDPLSHYINTGIPGLLDPNPGLNAQVYAAENPDRGGMDPLLHWWRIGAGTGRDPAPLFDAAWYRGRHNLGAADPLAHWLDTDRTGPTHPLHLLAGGKPDTPVLPPPGDAPDVSIIVPVYGHPGDTMRCLHSVAACSGDGLAYEVIVADDNPALRVGPMLPAAFGEAVVVENPENLGFLRSCSNAARHARGRHLLFLNNDTVVHPDWLAPLVRLADADATVGLVGAKLLNADGTLQEAGGAILSNGWGQPYGAGDDPALPQYNFVREVDVAVGACILVPRAAWDAVGGFDEAYAPAFYEEFDLAFALRAAGFRTMYQPASVVTHHGSNSYGAEARDRQSAINHARFCRKWAQVLPGQPAPDATPYQQRERPPQAGTVLVIDDRVPEWDRHAGGLTISQYLHLFRGMGWRVAFLPAADPAPLQPYTGVLQQAGIEVLHAPERLEDWLRANGGALDLVWTARPDVTGPRLDLIRAHTSAPVIYYTHDLHHLRERRRYDLDGDPRALQESRRLQRIEERIFAAVDQVMTPSAEEARIIAQTVPAAKVHVIPPYIVRPAGPDAAHDFAAHDPAAHDPAVAQDALIFVGGFGHPPNVDAAAWLVRDIMPAVWLQEPSVKLLLVGSAPPAQVKALAGPRVQVTGFVPDIAPLYARSRMSVSPLRYGAGVKGKIVASLQAGVPVVTTPVGNEGLDLIPGREALVADDAPALAAAILELWRDPALQDRLARAGQAALSGRYSEAAARRAVCSVLAAAVGVRT